ncbi:MAG TPA: thioredoxin family protein [Candidatus Hydrogenedentes bacterium]|jgi:peroxiredoxin|nr:thioredoxin family protein [Candidatus Hydrogenedentota bacterium]HPJ99707.1 thioredoxin family protein [Candidatus Hydrogenedentota bacterium]
MALTASTMMALGTRAPDFSLPDTDGNVVALKNFEDQRVLLVMFICNHCPYVKHVRDELAQLSRDYAPASVGMVAINANDVEAYPQDGVEAMRAEKQTAGYLFPYLFDESQATAKAYGAACTPDFFLFDSDRKLVYRGRLDDARPGNGLPVTGRDLRAALDAALAGQPVEGDQKPSMGCNIKWKPGNAPVYG